jgi:transposase
LIRRTDGQWERVAPLVPGKSGDPGRLSKRVFGLPAPARLGELCILSFGRWNSIFRRFRRWAVKGVFEILFKALSGDPDFEYAMIDDTIVRVHQHGARASILGM